MKKPKETVNSTFIRERIRRGGWNQDELCESILGIKRGTFTSSLSKGILRSDVIDKLAALLNVDRSQLLLASDVSEEIAITPMLHSAFTDRMALYNFLTSIEAAITNFRQDLLNAEKEASDGKI